MRKGQTALEYLMTYGWAILIVIIVVAALYALGLTKPCKWTGTQVTVPGGFSTDRAYIKVTSIPNGNRLQMKITNGLPEAVTFAAGALTFTITPTGDTGTWPSADTTLQSGQTATFTVDMTGGDPDSVAVGDCYTIDITGSYSTAGVSHDFSARITGPVEAG
jgi:hypothetical protein